MTSVFRQIEAKLSMPHLKSTGLTASRIHHL
jgi:hypothetical protein